MLEESVSDSAEASPLAARDMLDAGEEAADHGIQRRQDAGVEEHVLQGETPWYVLGIP